MSLRIVIAEEDATVRRCLLKVLQARADMEVVGEFENVSSFEDIVKLRPHVVLLGFPMAGKDAEFASRLRRQVPDMKIIGLFSSTQDHDCLDAIGDGVTGFLIKASIHTDLIRAINTVRLSCHFYSPQMAVNMLALYREQYIGGSGRCHQPKQVDNEAKLLAQLAASKSPAKMDRP